MSSETLDLIERQTQPAVVKSYISTTETVKSTGQ